PNEVAAPGKPPYNAGETSGGKDSSGGVPDWIAGTWSSATVRFVDDFWNLVPGESRSVSVYSSDPNDAVANGGPDPTAFTMNGSSVVPWRFITGTGTGWKLWAESNPVLLFTTSTAVNVSAVATQLQVLLPGETAAPGTPTGKTGSPSAWTAGIATTVVVHAVDQFWNIGSLNNSQVQLTVTDSFAQFLEPGTKFLENGTTTYLVRLRTRNDGAARYTATRIGGTGLPSPIADSAFFATQSSSVAKLQIVAPGEVGEPGSATGKKACPPDCPVAWKAGVSSAVIVNAVDAYYNVVAAEQSQVYLHTTDPYDIHPSTLQLVAGATTFNFAMVTSSSWTITAYSTTSYLSSASTMAYVGVSSAARFLVVLPGESFNQGECDNALLCQPPAGAPGISGQPDFGNPGVRPSTAGVTFAAEVYLTDNFFNRVVTHPGTSVGLTPSDPYGFATAPPINPQALTGGFAGFTLSLRTAAAGHFLTAAESGSANGYAAKNSSTFTVVADNPTQMLVTLPSEIQINGKNTAPQGKSGGVFLATATTAGCYQAGVYAVDNFYNWNQTVAVTSVTAQTLTDPNDIDPPGEFVLYNGSAAVSNICPKTARRPSNHATAPDAVIDDAQLRVLWSAGPINLGLADSSLFTVVPNAPQRVQALAPGECTDPGSASGRGACNPASQPAASNFNVELRVTDAFWNLVSTITTGNETFGMTSPDDPNDIEPGPQTVNISSTAFTLNLTRAATQQIEPFDDEANIDLFDSADLADAKTKEISVVAGAADRIILIHEAQSLNEGATTYQLARVGLPAGRAAGQSFNVKVYVTDAFFNVKAGFDPGGVIRVRAPNDTFGDNPGFTGTINGAGYADITVTGLRKAATGQYLTATYEGSGSLNAARKTDPPTNPVGVTASTFTVSPGAMQGIQLLMPWETADAGRGVYPNGGKIVGSTSTFIPYAPNLYAGVSFTAQTRVVDQYFNTVPTAVPNTYLVTSDKFDVSPATSTFDTDGTKSFALTLRTRATDHTLYASNPNLNFPGTNEEPNAANMTAQFFTESSAPVRLMVLLPGEAEVEGKPADVDEFGNAAPGEPAGKKGLPGTFTIGGSTGVVVSMVDAYYNRVRIVGLQPTVNLQTPLDLIDATEAIAAKLMIDGQASFSPATGDGVFPLFARPDYVVGSTYTIAPAAISSGVSAAWNVWPGSAHHLHFDDVAATTGTTGMIAAWTPTVTAGDSLNARVTAHDQYHNVLSTGTNLYVGTIVLEAQSPSPANPNQNPDFPSSCGTQCSFLAGDVGSKLIAAAFKLKQASPPTRWVRVKQLGVTTPASDISTERTTGGFSLAPVITVNAGPPIAVKVSLLPGLGTDIPGGGYTPAADDIEARAGNVTNSPTNLGRVKFEGQMVDQFDNAVIQAGATAYIQVVDVSPAIASGTIRLSSGYTDVGVSTTMLTNASGQVGVSTPIWYFTYNQSTGTTARVWIGTSAAPADLTPFLGTLQNLSKKITTIGGTVTKAFFTSVPTGSEIEAGTPAPYRVQRRDDFDNPVTVGSTDLNVYISAAEETVHSDAGFTKVNSGAIAGGPALGYGFTDGGSFIQQVTIPDGVLSGGVPNANSVTFNYLDKMSSTPDGEDGRASTWTIRSGTGLILETAHALKVNPKVTDHLSFDNLKNKLRAGSPINPDSGVPITFEVELRDNFENPTPAGAAVKVYLHSTRNPSPSLNSYDFSQASMTTTVASVPVFVNSTGAVVIPLGQYYTTFYYLDTTASLAYGASSTTMPSVWAEAPPQTWTLGAQAVEIIPESVDNGGRMALINPYRTLTAGATSQAFTLQIQDKFGNPTPQPGGPDRSFRADSNSTGTVRFASPCSTCNVTFDGATEVWISSLAAGQIQTDFFVIDNLARVSTLTITSGGLATITSSYTVLAAAPHHLTPVSSSLRLIAGTTVQYQVTSDAGTPGDPTDDVRVQMPSGIVLELRDAFENVTTTDVPTQVFFDSPDSLRVGQVPTMPLVNGADWTQLDLVSNKQFDLNANESQMTVYVWDTVAGTSTLTAIASIGSLSLANFSSDIVITPGPAAYFTVHHNFTNATPLKVTEDTSNLTVRARDRYGNVADGDAANGQYYKKRANFSISSPLASLTNRENNPPTNAAGTTYYNFSPVNDATPGVYSLLGIRSDIVPTSAAPLRVNATDQATIGLPDADPNKIFGFTGDASRPWAFGGSYPPATGAQSSPDVVVAGVVVSPTDMAPDPSAAKQGVLAGTVYAGMRELFQGSGVIEPTYPILMWKLSMLVSPAGSGLSARLNELRVLKQGDLPAQDVASVELYVDATANGTFCPNEAFLQSKCANPDIAIASATFSNWSGTYWNMVGISTAFPSESLLTTTNRDYYLAVRISSTADLAAEKTFGLRLAAANQNVVVATVTAGSPLVAMNNFEMLTATTAVKRAPAQVYTSTVSADIAAWIDGVRLSTAAQGKQFVGMLKVPLWTGAFTSSFDKIVISRIGDSGSGGSDADIKAVRLYMDTFPQGCGNFAAGNGTFETGNDTLVSDPANPAVFSGGVATVRVQDIANCGLIEPSTHTYYIAFDFSDSAALNKTHAVLVNPGNIFMVPGTGSDPAFTVMQSSFVTVVPTFDTGRVTGRLNMVTASQVQASTNVALAQWTMSSNQGSVIWTGVKMDRWSHSSQGGVKRNKSGDAANLRVYLDSGTLGTFEPNVDLLVTPFGVTQTFPESALAGSLSDVETSSLQVVNFGVFRGIGDIQPTEEPFLPDLAPGRLVLGDDQTDESLKEIIYYSGYNEATKHFTGLTRGADGTTPRNWSTGTVLSGQARLRLKGTVDELARGLSGTELVLQDKKYIVTMDLANLASVESQSRLGIEMRTTDYFKILAPDLMSPTNIGIAPDLTNAYIQTVTEYEDQVTATPADVNAGLNLMQGTTNLAFMTFTMAVDKGDALWRRIIVRATGTATADGQVVDEVDRLWLYQDVNGNFLLDVGTDTVISSAPFNTSGPLFAKLEFGQSTTTTRRLLTAPQRYLLAVDVKSDAVVTDPVTGAPRTLALAIDEASFPMINDNQDVELDDSISWPNKRPQTFSFITLPHTLVPAPQVLTVNAEPVFTDPGGNMLPAARLTKAVTTTGPLPVWPISSRLGLATSGYALIDNEIIGYSGTAAGCAPDGPDCLTGVSRGVLGSTVVVHGLDAVVGGQVIQGQKYRSAVKLMLSASEYEIQWSQIRLKRVRPDPLNGADPDVSKVRIFKDINGDGLLNLDLSGNPIADVEVASGNFSGSFATLQLRESGRDYVLIRKILSPATFFVTLDIDPTASFSEPGVANLNEVVGVELDGQSPSSIVTGPSGVGHSVVLTTTVASPTYLITPTSDTLRVTALNMADGLSTQNNKNEAVLKLELNTRPGQNTARLTSVRFDLLGSGVNSDLANVKIWKDENNNGEFDDFVSSGNLLTAGNDFFTDRFSVVSFKEPLVIGTATIRLFVSVDISEFGQVGKTVGLSLSSTDYFTVAIPDGKEGVTSFPFNSSLNTIMEAASVVSIGVYDAAASLGSTGVSQAQTRVPMLRFNMRTDISQARWTKLQVERTGASSDISKPAGRNKDVKFIKIYRDLNGNDSLDVFDPEISSQKTSLVATIPAASDPLLAISSAAAPPFDLVLASTEGFPASGDVLVGDVELMRYTSISTSAAALRITSRARLLGDANTPALSLSSGAVVEKVDLFVQDDDNDRVRLIELSVPQIFSPAAQTYFLGLDIGDGAVVGNGIGLQIPGPSAIVVDFPPDTVSGQAYVNVSQFPPLPNGTTVQALPYQTSKVVVGGAVLQVSGLSLAPAAAERGKTGVALLRLDLQTKQSVVDVGALRLTQKGSAYCTAASTDNAEACGLVALSLYREADGNGSFGAFGDVLIGEVRYSSQPGSNFNLGVATLAVTVDGLPRLRVGTELTTLYVVGTIGAAATLGDKVGISLDIFPHIKGAGGVVSVAAVPDIVKYPPVTSLQTEIVPLLVPAVAVSNSYAPIVVARSGRGTGYPGYALVSTNTAITIDGQTYKCNTGKDPTNARNNICVDIKGSPVADQARWICSDGSPWATLSGSTWTARCPNDPPYIDINGDGVPDNFKFGANALANSLSLVGEGLPTMDVTDSGILDLDLNKDGIVDVAVPDGFGGLKLMLGTDPTDPGNTATAINIPDQGFVPSVWTGKTGELAATLPVMSIPGYYEIAVGSYYDDPIGLSGAWSRVDAVASGLSAKQFSVLAASGPASIARIGNLTLPVPNITRLMENVGPNTLQFEVENAGRLQLPNVVYVGSEIMRVNRVSGNILSVEAIAGDPPPGTGRGLRGSAPIQHLRGEPVSDGAAILFARFISTGASVAVSTSQPRALFMFRPDPAVPSTPGEVKVLEKGRTTYPLEWTRSLQSNSGVMAYEVQERGGDPKDLQSMVVWRTLNIVNAGRKSALGTAETGADSELYSVGDPKYPGETPRPFNQFYSYRVRAISASGVMSDWSPLGGNALTGISNEIISGVSNYPNPFDSRKGGELGRTQITYTLNADAEVTITIYDALGYIVKTITSPPGASGGRAGANFVPWDGRNGSGAFAAKGGYIARIKVKAPGGSASVIRKIGLIH
ncbi:MAG: hypothetical protein HY403_07500, partial [Elusimicrobia bacterium]|nr:hypothetical protein [Elusimicrobiota bacterium]